MVARCRSDVVICSNQSRLSGSHPYMPSRHIHQTRESHVKSATSTTVTCDCDYDCVEAEAVETFVGLEQLSTLHAHTGIMPASIRTTLNAANTSQHLKEIESVGFSRSSQIPSSKKKLWRPRVESALFRKGDMSWLTAIEPSLQQSERHTQKAHMHAHTHTHTHSQTQATRSKATRASRNQHTQTHAHRQSPFLPLTAQSNP